MKGVPRAWKKVVDEASKCVLLCKNCHEEVHARVTKIPDDIRRFVPPATGLPLRRTRVVKKKEKTKPRIDQRKVPNRPVGKALREMVNRASKVAVAKKFGVSEAAVRKWLKSDSQNGLYLPV